MEQKSGNINVKKYTFLRMNCPPRDEEKLKLDFILHSKRYHLTFDDRYFCFGASCSGHRDDPYMGIHGTATNLLCCEPNIK